MKSISVFWRFSRPHTMVGTCISILTLFIIICSHDRLAWLPLLAIALAIGLLSNIFIVGINQIADVNIDKINKPYLPIPSGDLSIYSAKVIVFLSLITSLVLSLFVSGYLFLIIAISSFIGWAYSMPPMYFKKHHVTAALAILIVRGIMINIGGFLVFNYLVNKSFDWPADLKMLTIFIIAFSVVIAWFKDMPDVEGDAKYHIKSLAIVYTPRATFIIGNLVVISVYLLTICWKFADLHSAPLSAFRDKILLYGNIFLMFLFVINAGMIDLKKNISLKKFYKRFWWFFFAEYLLYLVAYLF